MKIYTKVVMDMRTGEILEEESFKYTGPIAECKGGGGVTHTTATTKGEIDYAYNRRMAAIAERQQAMSEEYMTFWREEYKPMEIAQIQANKELIPEQVGTERAKLGLEREAALAKTELLPEETALKRGLLEAGQEELTAAKPVISEYYKEALRGVDSEARVAQARADVGMAFKETEGTTRRAMGRMGITPSGDRAASMLADRNMEMAKSTAGAMTGARERAKTEGFQRLQGASSFFKGGIRR